MYTVTEMRFFGVCVCGIVCLFFIMDDSGKFRIQFVFLSSKPSFKALSSVLDFPNVLLKHNLNYFCEGLKIETSEMSVVITKKIQ